jgi:integrase
VTAEKLKELRPSERDSFLWDDKLAGFGVKITPAGSLVYVLQYRLGGRGSPTRRYTIGSKGWKPHTAREEAERLLRLISQGVDIQAQAKEAVKADGEAKRIATELAFDSYVDRFAETNLKAHWPKSWKQTQGCLKLHAVSRWQDRALPSITKADIRKALAALDGKPATKRNLYSALSYLFAQAVKAEDLDSNPMEGLDPPPMVAARAHTLDRDELRWLWWSSFDLPDPYGTIYRQFILLGQRRGEIAGMDWRELNRGAGEWHIPPERAKNGTETLVPLPSSTVAVLDAIAGKDRWPRQGLVFPSSAGTPVSGFSKTKIKLDALMAARAQQEGGAVRSWRTHDLRRTLATNQQALGTPFEVVEHLLNHKEKSRTGIGAVYQTHAFKAEKRIAIERWEAELMRIVEGAETKILPFRVKASG